MGTDTSIGTVDWFAPDRAKIEDGINTYVNPPFSGLTVAKEYSVRLVKGGTITGDDKSTGATLPATLTYVSYGGSTDLWGVSLTPSDVNSSTFGVVFSASNNAVSVISYYLKATNFGFSIPTGATINGVEVAIKQIDGNNGDNQNYVEVDHIRITVYYTPLEIQYTKFIFVSTSDGIGVTDTISLARVLNRSFSDNIGLSDSLIRTFTIDRNVLDNLTLSDIINREWIVSVTLEDGITITDVLQQLYQEVGITSVKWESVDDIIPHIEAILDGANNSNKIEDLDDFLPQVDSVDQV